MKIQEEGKVWERKMAVDLSEYEYENSEIRDPSSIAILIPRIEAGRKDFISNPIQNKTKAAKILFDNITQKLTETFILYDCFPVLGFDNTDMARARLGKVRELVHLDSIHQISTILASPSTCWGNILDKKD
jgi:hypothetical protein